MMRRKLADRVYFWLFSTGLLATGMLWGYMAHAQEITFTAETTSGAGQVVPVLTWSTVPAASSCVASGDWGGEKGAAGSETLAAITASGTYNLSCVWLADGDVTLTWTNPTENTDGSPYTDAAGTYVEYSPDGQAPWFRQPPTPELLPGTSYVVADLAPGDWFFRVYAENQAGVVSDASNIAVKTVLADQETVQTIGITVNPKPEPPTGLTAN